jgi:hypothetical protein
MIRIIRKIFPDRGIYNSILLMVIPAAILYIGDGKLEEIYNFENLPIRVTALNKFSSEPADTSFSKFKMTTASMKNKMR